ncbi:MAG: MnhB domain-containing protein [Acholeplasmataceae bacterium]
MNDIILKTITRMIVPMIQAYGIYIILYGHVSPGGGFSGGAMIGTSLILYTLVFGLKKGKKKFSHRASEIAESGGILVFIAIGLIGMITAGRFLTNVEAGFPRGEPGTLLSAGMIPILMIGIGIKVASTMVTLFHMLIEEEIE